MPTSMFALPFLVTLFFFSLGVVYAQVLPCGSDEYGSLDTLSRSEWLLLHSKVPSTQSEDGLRVLRLAVEADTKFFTENGSNVDSAKAYIFRLVKATSRIFERELGITLQVVWTKVWTTSQPDPYQCGGDGVALGESALKTWQANTTVQRDVVLCLTSGGGGGIGYQFTASDGGGLTSVCTPSALAAASPFAATSLPTAGFTYSVYIIAHELGHVLGAVHSHNCYWAPPLDTCTVRNDPQFASGDACLVAPVKPRPSAGSLMSYCGGVNNAKGFGYTLRMTFLDRISSYIKQQIQTVSCNLEPSTPTIVLLTPQHGLLVEHTPITIQWLASNVSNVTIEWRRADQDAWTEIESGMFSDRDSTSWLPPQGACDYDAVIRVRSSYDEGVADTTDIPVHIAASATQCLRTSLAFDSGKVTVGCIAPADGYGGHATTDRRETLGGAWAFNNSNPFVLMDALGPETEGTFILWVQTTTNSGVQHIVGTNWEQSATASLFVWEGTLGSAVWSTGASAPQQAWGPVLTPNRWYQLALTYSANQQNIYVDGELAATQPLPSAVSTNKASVFVGKRGNNAEPLYGSVDDVRIYSCALSSDSVRSLFNAEKSTPSNVAAKALDDRMAICAAKIHDGFLQVEIPPSELFQYITLYNVLGNECSNSTNTNVPITNLPCGQYVVVVRTDHRTAAIPLILCYEW